MSKVRVGIVGTSWWADAMYMPPLTNHPDAEVVAACGRRRSETDEFADRWSIPHRFTDFGELIDSGLCDAVVVSTSNDSHHAITMRALDRGLHVLCEKPLALNVAQAEEMTAKAAEAGVITMVPFTYSFMPVFQFARRLVAEGYVGKVHHVNMRYYTAYAFDPTYTWRFDPELSGSGVIGDLASHWVYVSRWLIDDTEESVGAMASTFVEREPRPDGSAYEPGEDSVVLTVRYASGAYGILQTCAVSWEGTEPFGQTHHLEIHGDAGTIYGVCDWDTVQEVRGVRRGETGPAQVLPIPDDIWQGVRRDTVHNTYRDVFRETDAMTRGWISAITEGRPAKPDFADGLAVQRVLDAAVQSAKSGSVHVAI